MAASKEIARDVARELSGLGDGGMDPGVRLRLEVWKELFRGCSRIATTEFSMMNTAKSLTDAAWQIAGDLVSDERSEGET